MLKIGFGLLMDHPVASSVIQSDGFGLGRDCFDLFTDQQVNLTGAIPLVRMKHQLGRIDLPGQMAGQIQSIIGILRFEGNERDA
jgi:hypothetical protein